MGRWGNEMWGGFTAHQIEHMPDAVYVATYAAKVDVDIVEATLRFNEALHPDEILKALLVDYWGSISLGSWPPAECTEQNRFRLMALLKIAIFLDMAEYTQALGTPLRSRDPKRQEPPDAPRAWAYDQFPAARAALAVGGGPYRTFEFDARIRDDGFVIHDYYLPDEGIVLPGLEDDMSALAFVRALVQTDLFRRIEALCPKGRADGEGTDDQVGPSEDELTSI